MLSNHLRRVHKVECEVLDCTDRVTDDSIVCEIYSDDATSLRLAKPTIHRTIEAWIANRNVTTLVRTTDRPFSKASHTTSVAA